MHRSSRFAFRQPGAIFALGLLGSQTVLPGRAPDSLPVLVGTVTKIVDGDTIDVQLSSGPIRVRLHGIDTPERGQPGGKEATAGLSMLVAGKDVQVEPFEQGRYERMIEIVYLDDLNVTLEQVKQGRA